MSATDPANPYGALLPWPETGNREPGTGNRHPASGNRDPGTRGHRSHSASGNADAAPAARGATRTAGARVVLVDGHMACWIARGNRALIVSLPEDEPDRSRVGRAMARQLVALAHGAPEGERGWLIAEINGQPADAVPLKQYLINVGFVSTSRGLRYPSTEGRQKKT